MKSVNTKLFVGNLSFSTGEQQLRDSFSEFGQLRSASIVTDRQTGRPRGFGFVEFETGDDAQRAVEQLDGSLLEGRSINVSIAREREPRRFDGPPGGGGGFGGGGGGGRGGGRGGGGGRSRSEGGRGSRGSDRW